ncbi:hypothetical protein VP01_3395g1 [Puccinia sorghi]|uniref:Uncharacterized protein n=1 Tax=Puccinia sorghi TaxID=27349 RepID=A0A0L6UXJ9_9BASI|nr:hypothetical protein VP01_3395g1 [Puccinia sorghi]
MYAADPASNRRPRRARRILWPSRVHQTHRSILPDLPNFVKCFFLRLQIFDVTAPSWYNRSTFRFLLFFREEGQEDPGNPQNIGYESALASKRVHRKDSFACMNFADILLNLQKYSKPRMAAGILVNPGEFSSGNTHTKFTHYQIYRGFPGSWEKDTLRGFMSMRRQEFTQEHTESYKCSGDSSFIGMDSGPSIPKDTDESPMAGCATAKSIHTNITEALDLADSQLLRPWFLQDVNPTVRKNWGLGAFKRIINYNLYLPSRLPILIRFGTYTSRQNLLENGRNPGRNRVWFLLGFLFRKMKNFLTLSLTLQPIPKHSEIFFDQGFFLVVMWHILLIKIKFHLPKPLQSVSKKKACHWNPDGMLCICHDWDEDMYIMGSIHLRVHSTAHNTGVYLGGETLWRTSMNQPCWNITRLWLLLISPPQIKIYVQKYISQSFLLNRLILYGLRLKPLLGVQTTNNFRHSHANPWFEALDDAQGTNTIPQKVCSVALPTRYEPVRTPETWQQGWISFSPAPHLNGVAQYLGLEMTTEDVNPGMALEIPYQPGLYKDNQAKASLRRTQKPILDKFNYPQISLNLYLIRLSFPHNYITQLHTIYTEISPMQFHLLSTRKKLNSPHFCLEATLLVIKTDPSMLKLPLPLLPLESKKPLLEGPSYFSLSSPLSINNPPLHFKSFHQVFDAVVQVHHSIMMPMSSITISNASFHQ